MVSWFGFVFNCYNYLFISSRIEARRRIKKEEDIKKEDGGEWKPNFPGFPGLEKYRRAEEVPHRKDC